MRYHYEKPFLYFNKYGTTYECNHPIYNRCTLFEIGERDLDIIQQRYDSNTKNTWWSEIDPWLTDEIYLHPKFKEYFDNRYGKPFDGMFPTVTIRQIMWALKMNQYHESDGKPVSIEKIFNLMSRYLHGIL